MEHSRNEASLEVAVAFVDATEQTVDLLARHPTVGAPRYAREPARAAFSPRCRLPFRAVHVERANYVDVWRFPHGHRDILSPVHSPDD